MIIALASPRVASTLEATACWPLDTHASVIENSVWSERPTRKPALDLNRGGDNKRTSITGKRDYDCSRTSNKKGAGQ